MRASLNQLKNTKLSHINKDLCWPEYLQKLHTCPASPAGKRDLGEKK